MGGTSSSRLSTIPELAACQHHRGNQPGLSENSLTRWETPFSTVCDPVDVEAVVRPVAYCLHASYGSQHLGTYSAARYSEEWRQYFGHFWGVAPRNIDRASRRWRREDIPPIPGERGPLTLADGTALQIPPGDETVPDLPQGVSPYAIPSREISLITMRRRVGLCC